MTRGRDPASPGATRIDVEIVIDATPEEIWRELEQVERHVDWMADAETIDFHGDQRRGEGTSFRCVTKVGPIRLDDEMTITRWEKDVAIGVRHEGIVTGEGTFVLEAVNARSTRVRWSESLRFPWWMAGRAGGVAGGPVLRAIWRRNLRSLRDIVENGS